MPQPQEKQTPSDAPSFAWTKDPTVIVSRRNRNVTFPGTLLTREATDEDRRRWRDPIAQGTTMQNMTILAGVTFIGAMTSQFALQSVAGIGMAPTSAPPAEHLRLIIPETSASSTLGGPLFVDRETRRVVPARVHEAILRVLKWMQDEEKHLLRERGVEPLLFTSDDGFDPNGPEVMLLPLSEVFAQRTEHGRHAYVATQQAIKWAKNGQHLGALHDYAARDRGAWNIVLEARTRVGKVPSLAGNR